MRCLPILSMLAVAGFAAAVGCQKKSSSATSCTSDCPSTDSSSGGSSGTPPIGVGGSLPSTYKVLYDFPASSNLANPGHDLLLVENKLYLGVVNGGATPCPIGGILLPCGSVISVNTDGSGETTLHNFIDSEGAALENGLTLGGTILYGTATQGGTSQVGTIFSMGLDGSSFKLLHTFTGGTTDGASPYGTMTLIGDSLYGTTHDGGSSQGGTVFKISTDGTGFTILHNFQGGADDGAGPTCNFAMANGTLFGTTTEGGSGSGINGNGARFPGGGTIFSMAIDGSAYQVLHNFDWATDGCCSPASLRLAGNTLYGMTGQGAYGTTGSWDAGTVFSIQTDGSGYQVLHKFSSSSGSPSYTTYGTLALSNNTLWGQSSEGGIGPCDTRGCGTIFSIGTDGSGLKTYSFPYGGADAGDAPEGSILIDGNVAYGTALNVPGSGSWGVVYSFEIPDATAASTGTGVSTGTGTSTGT